MREQTVSRLDGVTVIDCLGRNATAYRATTTWGCHEQLFGKKDVWRCCSATDFYRKFIGFYPPWIPAFSVRNLLTTAAGTIHISVRWQRDQVAAERIYPRRYDWEKPENPTRKIKTVYFKEREIPRKYLPFLIRHRVRKGACTATPFCYCFWEEGKETETGAQLIIRIQDRICTSKFRSEAVEISTPRQPAHERSQLEVMAGGIKENPKIQRDVDHCDAGWKWKQILSSHIEDREDKPNRIEGIEDKPTHMEDRICAIYAHIRHRRKEGESLRRCREVITKTIYGKTVQKPHKPHNMLQETQCAAAMRGINTFNLPVLRVRATPVRHLQWSYTRLGSSEKSAPVKFRTICSSSFEATKMSFLYLSIQSKADEHI